MIQTNMRIVKNHACFSFLSVAVAVLLFMPNSGLAFDFGKTIKDARKSVDSQVEETRGGKPAAENTSSTTKSAKSADTSKKGVQGASSGGVTNFSKSPIDPRTSPTWTTSFQAGDRIYSLLDGGKPWAKHTKDNYLMVNLFIDDTKYPSSIGLKRDDLMQASTFALDIAPDSAKMTNYRDKDVIWQDKYHTPTKKNYRWGPEFFTRLLADLSPGKHTIRIEVQQYNRMFTSGQFQIEGSDFSVYGKLNEEISGSAGKMEMMPSAGMKSADLEKQMNALMKNRSYKVERLYLTDKDWWIERVSGGDSAVKSRYIAAAVAFQEDSKYFYSIVKFQQPMLITGAWGALVIMDIGQKKSIPKENIQK
jgi:hypothetical protein